MDKGLLVPDSAPDASDDATTIQHESLPHITNEIEGIASGEGQQDEIEMETDYDMYAELSHDNEADNTVLKRFSSPCCLRWWGLQPLTDDEKKTDISPLSCTSMCVHRPLIFLAAALVAIVILCVMGFRSEAHLDLGIDQFRLSNQDCRIQREDMLESAKNDATESIPGKSHGRRLSESTWVVLARLEVLYYPKKGDNILTEENFQEIHRIEKTLMSRHGYEKYCFGGDSLYKDFGLEPRYRHRTYGDYRDCSPPQSLMTYFFPSTKSNGKVVYDGLSDEMLPLNIQLSAISGVKNVHYFVDASADLAKGKAKYLKTLLLFAAPFPKTSAHYRKAKKQFKPWLLEYTDMFAKIQSEQVRVVHGGEIITKDEIKNIVYSDAKFAALSVAFVVVYSVWYLRSFFLALLGIAQIACTLPITFYACQLIHRIPGYAKLTDLGVMNVLSLYLLLGIGVDDLYVMTDAFRQAKRKIKLDDGTVVPVTNRLRMSYAFRRSAQAMFLTSLTTAVAFLANMTIIIPVIYQFVLFMALLIIINYILAVTVFPLLLSVREKYLKRDSCGNTSCEQRVEQCCGYLGGGLCSALVRCGRSSCDCARRSKPESPAMIALTDINAISEDPSERDEAILEAENGAEERSDRDASHEQATLFGRTLAAATIHPGGRLWQPLVVGGVFALFFGVSLWTACQLKPAQGIPGLFRADDNIQIFLNSLTTSFGKRYCYDCSADRFYDSLCDGNMCSNHGKCANGLCTCHSGWSGAKCQTNLCADVNCGSDRGKCAAGKCICNPGYKGNKCQFVDRCQVPIPISCGRLQTCVDGICKCVLGYTKVYGTCVRQSTTTSKRPVFFTNSSSSCPVNPAVTLAGRKVPSSTCDAAVQWAIREGIELNCNKIEALLPMWSCKGCRCKKALATTPAGRACFDAKACNYKPGAAKPDNSLCVYPVANRDCAGKCVVAKDCAGTCGGSTKIDRCGVCGGDDSSCKGCMNLKACNYNGDAKIASASMCRFAKPHYDCFNVCKSPRDCSGECGGIRIPDVCGVCGGSGSSCSTLAATGTVSSLPATTGMVSSLPATTGAVSSLSATAGTVSSLPATTGTVSARPATTGAVSSLPATTGAVSSLPATAGTVSARPATTRVFPMSTSSANSDTTLGTSRPDTLEKIISDMFKAVDTKGSVPQTVHVKVDKRTPRLVLQQRIADSLGIPASRVVVETAKGGKHRRLDSSVTYKVTVLPSTACADRTACNFKANAACSYDLDCKNVCGGKAQRDICGVCGGDSSTCTGCMQKTACNFDKHAKRTGGVKCVFPKNKNFDCFHKCIARRDCRGMCGGHRVKDRCGVCGGDDSTCKGCMDRDACNFDADARVPGACRHPELNKNCKGQCLDSVDCFGICAGSSKIDSCGLCGGDGSSCRARKHVSTAVTSSTSMPATIELLCSCSVGMTAKGIPADCINGVLRVCRSPSLSRKYSWMCTSCEAAYTDPETPWDSCGINVIRIIGDRCSKPKMACTKNFCSGHGTCSVDTSLFTRDQRVCKCDTMYAGSHCNGCTAPFRVYPDCTTPNKAEAAPINTNLARVSMVWGLEGVTYAPRYEELPTPADGFTTSYNLNFDLNDPDAQLFLYDACLNISSQSRLVQQRLGSGLEASKCFIREFKTWLETRGIGFPVPRGREHTFVKYLHLFWSLTGRGTDQFGFDNYTSPPTRVTYAVFSFYTHIPRYGSGFARLPHFSYWETALHTLNNRAPPTAKGVMQTSEIWESVFTEVIAVSGTMYSIVVVVLIAFWAILVFTTNVVAALLAIASILFALVVILASFHWLGWTLGIVEAIGISILLGAAVDYPLHLVESYIETSPEVARDDGGDGDEVANKRCHACCSFSKARIEFRRRVITVALSKIGPSILNSALTTSGCVLFLFACRINIFVKVGTIMLMSSVVSITLTMFLLPPLLLLFGPVTFHRQCKRIGILAVSVAGVFGAGVLVLYLLSLGGVQINGPSGTPFFYNRLLQSCIEPMY